MKLPQPTMLSMLVIISVGGVVAWSQSEPTGSDENRRTNDAKPGAVNHVKENKSASSEAPPPVKLPIIVQDSGNSENRFTGELELTRQHQSLSVPDAFSLPFAKIRVLQLSAPKTVVARLDVQFDFIGDPDKKRRILIELSVTGPAGNTVYHSWRLGSDVRTEPEPKREGKLTRMRPPHSSVWLTVPTYLLVNETALQLRFRAVTVEDLKYLPDEPSPTALTITRPDAEGHFTVSFDNPSNQNQAGRWELEPQKHQVIFQLFVKNGEGKLQQKIFKQLAARPSGGYQVNVALKPELFEHSTVSVAFVTIQPDHEKWVEDFFQRGKGTSYRGIWSGDGGQLIRTTLNGELVGWVAADKDPKAPE